MHLNRRLHDYYKLSRGSEQIIVGRFFKWIKSDIQYSPDNKSDVLYLKLRKDFSSNILKLSVSSDIMKRLASIKFKREVYFLLIF
ncbi:hypothetical protein THOM_0616 [Trachipleistophora hominis]|uniref:Uncharacterized protein n=1 Tax=Trachipleistophora hominis TaxID=72359 RepID=L7JY55_TRAHO|nr:hypothetical protein THOM_0616 [Trachipleistophora hominis]